MPKLKPEITVAAGWIGKAAKTLLPLIIIGIGVYVVFNFPALKTRLTYAVNKPAHGDPAKLPSFIGGQAGSKAPGIGIPIGTAAQCGNHPVGFDKNGNPKLICDDYIYIPNIGVGAPLIYTTSTNPSVVDGDLLKGVVHYPGTAIPGEQGNVFLTGHSSFYWWDKSEYKTVFTLVPKLTGGDLIVIYHKGIRYLYRVTEGFEVAPSRVEVLEPTAVPTLTLSTCVPIGTAYRRFIIRAVQTDPDPKTNVAPSTPQKIPNKVPGAR